VLLKEQCKTIPSTIMILSEILVKLSKKIEANSGVSVVVANIATAHDDDSSFDKSTILFQ